ncbi:MAG TPA: hypothetical protein PLX89_26950, partial [Verrucomicrobiota bacterium]|nr:hypothetical protein [Verrucomicrobiota bacterium]
MNPTPNPMSSRQAECRWIAVLILLRLLPGVPVACGQPVLEAPFTRVTNAPFATLAYGSVSAAWGDFNSDGWL